ncbi:MAG: HD domain-containing phosphohydrolase [Bacteriovoracaceae bacterium]|jgi:HD-GYP domain-containing protein (c-di-GMP phosphodiesterase class II)|nr:HD domain-containing phosphohydrolase [Bacteriovoracaceae bacterium]
MISFYKLKSDFFELDRVYSFNIFLFDKMREHRIVALYANSPLTGELKESWLELEAKGAYLQLYKDDKDDFHYETNVSHDELMELNAFYFKMFNLQESRLKKYEEKAKEKFLLKKTLQTIAKTNDFLPLIERVKSEVMCYPLYESDLTSMCTEVVDKTFSRDMLPVRVAAFAFFLARQNKITDREKLVAIIMASLMKDFGLSVLSTELFKNYADLENHNIYLKHPMLSIYILSKIGYEFPTEIKRIILEQHEQTDGSGFPRQKKEDHIAYLSFIVNLSDQIIMYSSGKINGRKTDLIKTIELFHKGVSAEGVNVNFPPRLLESLGSFLLNDLEKDLAKKDQL